MTVSKWGVDGITAYGESLGFLRSFSPIQQYFTKFPAGWTAGDPVVIYHHGRTEIHNAPLTDTTHKTATTDAILAAGWGLIGGWAFGDNWGNQNSLDFYAALEALAPTSPHLYWLQSMGGVSGFLRAANDAQCVAVAALMPVCDLSWIFTASSYKSSLKTAYGFSDDADYATATSGHDPMLLAADSWSGLGMRFYASAGDTLVTKADNTDAMAARITGTAENDIVVCTGQHGDPSHFQPDDIMSFWSRYI